MEMYSVWVLDSLERSVPLVSVTAFHILNSHENTNMGITLGESQEFMFGKNKNVIWLRKCCVSQTSLLSSDGN